jgi:hypothetical protein
VEINHDKKNETFTRGVISPVKRISCGSYQVSLAITVGKDMFYAELWKKLNQSDERTQFSLM